MTLGDYLRRAITEPWEWGRSDCSTFPADWVRQIEGIDPMARWRGTYASESEANDIIAAAGGLVALCAEGLDPIWPHCDAPTEGAVGIVTLAGEDGTPIDVGAIHTGKRWAIKSPRGLALITEPLAVRAVWAR